MTQKSLFGHENVNATYIEHEGLEILDLKISGPRVGEFRKLMHWALNTHDRAPEWQFDLDALLNNMPPKSVPGMRDARGEIPHIIEINRSNPFTRYVIGL